MRLTVHLSAFANESKECSRECVIAALVNCAARETQCERSAVVQSERSRSSKRFKAAFAL